VTVRVKQLIKKAKKQKKMKYFKSEKIPLVVGCRTKLSHVDDIIRTLFALFIAVLLVYVFFLVFWALSQALAIFFAFLVVIAIGAWLYERVRG
jgi:ABC-type proline/glycine betaine transport system permease subunit